MYLSAVSLCFIFVRYRRTVPLLHEFDPPALELDQPAPQGSPQSPGPEQSADLERRGAAGIEAPEPRSFGTKRPEGLRRFLNPGLDTESGEHRGGPEERKEVRRAVSTSSTPPLGFLPERGGRVGPG